MGSQRGGRSLGSVSIEAVILIPVFLGAIFTTLEASLWVHASSVAQAAAQDGARAATVMGGSELAGRNMAVAILNQRNVGDDWNVTTLATSDSVTVSVSGRAHSILPGIDFPVEESATMPWEAR